MITRACEPFIVTCNDDKPMFANVPTRLTVGKKYMVAAMTDTHYQITNDSGNITLYNKSRFTVDNKCQYCDKPIELWYGTEHNARLLHDKNCFKCEFWREIYEDMQKGATCYVIQGEVYHDGGDGEKDILGTRGHGGHRFYIVTKEGGRITTNNLWLRGDVPPAWIEKFPDNAVFTNSRWMTKEDVDAHEQENGSAFGAVR